MLRIDNIEEKRKKILDNAAMIRNAAGSIADIKNVVWNFDGKIYNKRFNDAIENLSDETRRFYCSNKYGFFYISFHDTNNFNYNNDVAVLSVYSCLSEDQIKNQTEENKKVFDGKRINAGLMIGALNETYHKLLKEAYELEKAAAGLELTIKQLYDTAQLFNSLLDSIPYKAACICGLRSYHI